jgi:hypothetical protein
MWTQFTGMCVWCRESLFTIGSFGLFCFGHPTTPFRVHHQRPPSVPRALPSYSHRTPSYPIVPPAALSLFADTYDIQLALAIDIPPKIGANCAIIGNTIGSPGSPQFLIPCHQLSPSSVRSFMPRSSCNRIAQPTAFCSVRAPTSSSFFLRFELCPHHQPQSPPRFITHSFHYVSTRPFSSSITPFS